MKNCPGTVNQLGPHYRGIHGCDDHALWGLPRFTVRTPGLDLTTYNTIGNPKSCRIAVCTGRSPFSPAALAVQCRPRGPQHWLWHGNSVQIVLRVNLSKKNSQRTDKIAHWPRLNAIASPKCSIFRPKPSLHMLLCGSTAPVLWCECCLDVQEGAHNYQCRRFSIKHTRATYVSPGSHFLVAMCCACAIHDNLSIVPCEACQGRNPPALSPPL